MNELDRAIGALLGLGIGDAVGTTLEFKAPGTFTPLDDMVGGGPFRLAAGAWTDDTSMALCLAESMLDTRTLLQSGNGSTPIGMFRPSAKVVSFFGLPSGPMPSMTTSRSLPGRPIAAYGYSTVTGTQSLPLASNASCIGLLMSGSLATS